MAQRLGAELSVPDLFATLTELTAVTVAAAINATGVDRVVAIFPDGRGFAWQQLNGGLAE
ncbi:MAG: hypothetical protein B7Z04_13145 [Rhodobacterales bacterium 32-66-9]|nr:MAG: hypothetical protein B7Z04_13145 [Rhodobacterales bacterium 32-66-9]